MKRNCAVVDKKTGEVVNKVHLEDGADWQPPEGCELVDVDAAIGDKIIDGKHEIQERLRPVELKEEDIPYSIRREEEYPNIGDQLDVLWKEQARRKEKGEVLAPETDKMLMQIQKVKERHPKE